MSRNALVNQHTGHLIMVGLAEVQVREYFMDILPVFTSVMTVKYGGTFVHRKERKGEGKRQEKKSE